jgi:tetratricopeptide (TPR) repeat protein
VERLATAAVREAGYYSYTGRYEEARRAGEHALDLYREAGDAVGEGQALRELGFLSWTAEDYTSALAYMREALKLHRQRGDIGGEATALHNLAEVHRSLGSPQQSIAEYQTALELYWARQDRQRQGLTLYGLGTAYRQMGELNAAAQRYAQALEQCTAAGDQLMVSRVRHALAGVHIQRTENDLALDQMRQALATSREIGYGPGIAYGLIVTSQLHTAAGRIDVARAHLEESLIWMRLAEDEPGAAEVQARLRALPGSAPRASPPEPGELPEAALLSTQLGWVKSHVVLAEGKVYCAFESPLAGCGPVPDDGRPTSDGR